MIYYILTIAAGILLGLFLNICIERVPYGKPVIGPSVRFRDIRLTGRNALVPLLTALVLALLYHRYSFSADFIAFSYLMSLLIIVFFIDIDHRIIPDEIVVAGLIGGIPVVIYNIFHPLGIYMDDRWWNPLLGILPGSGILFLVAFIGMIIYHSDDAMGMGDVKLFAPIGIFLGWRMCLLALLLAVVTAGISSVLLMIAGKKKRKDTIPFGPFIVTAAFITVMWGMDIVKWYFR